MNTIGRIVHRRAWMRGYRLFWMGALLSLLVTVCHASIDTLPPSPVGTATRAIDLSDQEKSWLSQLKPLRLGYEVDRYPYSFTNKQGQFEGMAADYAALLQSKLGIHLELVPARDLDELERLVKAGQVDVVAATTPEDFQSSGMVFTQPYESFPDVIVAPMDGTAVMRAQDLVGSRVAVRDEAGLLASLRQRMPGSHIIPVVSNEAGLAAVAAGDADAFVGTLPAVDSLLRDRYAGTLRVVASAEMDQDLAFGVSKSHAALLPLFDRALSSVTKNERRQIRDNRLDVRYYFGVPVDRVLIGIALGLGLFSIIAIAHLRLRRAMRALQRAEAHSRTLQERLGDICTTLPGAFYQIRCWPDGKRQLEYVAGDTVSLVGMAPAQIMENEPALFARIHPDDQAQLAKRWQAAMMPSPSMHALDFRVRVDGAWRWLRTDGSQPRRFDDGSVQWVGYWVDTTALHAQQEELVHAKQRAEEAVASKSMFFAMMSHEIRTPMVGVLGLIELLKKKSADSGQVRLLGVAHDAAKSLLTILDDILDYSRMESEHFQLDAKPVDLRAMADDLISLFAASANDKSIELRMTLDSRLADAYVADAMRLRQIMTNLLNNAVKFTTHGSVELRMELVATEGDVSRVRMAVADTGIGIAPSQRDRVLQPFGQADISTAQRFGGSGLGLAICQRLIHMMGGELAMESSPAMGTTVSFELPLPIARSLSTTGDEEDGESRSQPVSSARILVAEDNPVNRMVISEQLKELGYRHVLIEDGHKALDELGSSSYDLLITDNNMPGMSGHELIRRIRQGTLFGESRLPILVMSASAYPEEIDRYMTAGADDFLAKPATLEGLGTSIAKCLRAS